MFISQLFKNIEVGLFTTIALTGTKELNQQDIHRVLLKAEKQFDQTCHLRYSNMDFLCQIERLPKDIDFLLVTGLSVLDPFSKEIFAIRTFADSHQDLVTVLCFTNKAFHENHNNIKAPFYLFCTQINTD